MSKSIAHKIEISEIRRHYAQVRSVKTIIVIDGKLPEKEEAEIKRVYARKRTEKPKIIDSAPALAYVV